MKTAPSRALAHDFYARPLSGEEIEARSFEMIDEYLKDSPFDAAHKTVVQRLIHTVGDPEIRRDVQFSPDAVRSAAEALRRGVTIYTDSNMIRSGLSLARLRAVCPSYTKDDILCHVADPDVAAQAKDSRWPRSLFAVRKAAARLHGGIIAFGNAPVGLLEVNRLILEEGLRPALVIGMPVGFVHVVESKDELKTLPVPWIVLNGRRGGSPLAVAAIHALCGLAVPTPEARA